MAHVVRLARLMAKDKGIFQEFTSLSGTLSRRCLLAALQPSQLHSTSSDPHTSTSTQNADAKLSVREQNYTTFYRFPAITMARMISRMKIYQTGFTVVALPAMATAQSLGHFQDSSLAMSTGVAMFAGSMLYVTSHYFRRLVGAMGISDDQNTVRVSHLTFWGKRHDLFLPVEEIVPISELPDNVSDIYVKLCCYDSKDYLYYSIRYGNIVDKATFEYAIGKLK